MNTSRLNKEIKRLTAIKNERIVKALNARADLIIAEGAQARPLVCVSFYNGKEYATHGAVFAMPANGETDEKGNVIADRTVVRMGDRDTPHIYGYYESVEELAKQLSDRKIPHVIRFFDEDEEDAKPDANA